MVCSKTTLGYFALLVNNSFLFVVFIYNSTFCYKPSNVVKQFSWNRKNHIMNDSLIKDYLTFFKNEKVDLRNEGINEKIDFYFERTSFLNNIEIL